MNKQAKSQWDFGELFKVGRDAGRGRSGVSQRTPRFGSRSWFCRDFRGARATKQEKV
ncbi:MAG TPA: hypothetical protein VIJ24_07240 [Verrucomicrobiae bacterium]